MRRWLTVMMAAMLVMWCAPAAHAQDERRAGVVIAYPSSVGVQWQIADRLSVRADGDFAEFTNEVQTRLSFGSQPSATTIALEPLEFTVRTRSRNIELGLSVLFDVHRTDELRVYVAPRLGVNFGRTTISNEFNGDPGLLAAVTVLADSESTSRSPVGGVSMGASHDLSSRFRIFGEAGAAYRRGNFTGATGSEQKNTSLVLRGGVGAVILF